MERGANYEVDQVNRDAQGELANNVGFDSTRKRGKEIEEAFPNINDKQALNESLGIEILDTRRDKQKIHINGENHLEGAGIELVKYDPCQGQHIQDGTEFEELANDELNSSNREHKSMQDAEFSTTKATMPRYLIINGFEFQDYKLKESIIEPYFTKTKKTIKCNHFENLSMMLNDAEFQRLVAKGKFVITMNPENDNQSDTNGQDITICPLSITKEQGWSLKEYLEMLPNQKITTKMLPPTMDLLETFNTRYKSDKEQLMEIQGSQYLIPRCDFLVCDFETYKSHLLSNELTEKYDLIVMDPPWMNSSSKSKYSSLDCYKLLGLPLKNMLDSNGILAIWVTNNPKYHQFVLKWFKKLNLNYTKELVWLKLSTSGKPVIPLGNPRRKPYEVLLLASCTEFETKYDYIASVVNEHSQKPRIDFDALVGNKLERKLEMFARICESGYSCWGNETIKFNHFSYLSRK